METRARLTTAQRMVVLALIARGDSNSRVVKYIETEFQLVMTESAISKMKSVHKQIIRDMQKTMMEAQALDAEAIMKRARVHLNKRLNKAELDEDELDDLGQQYRAGDITLTEYRRKKAGLIQLSIPELVRISGAMHSQNKTDPLPAETPQLPAGTQQRPADLGTGNLEAILGALKSGNTVELQRIILGGKSNDNTERVPHQSANPV